MVIGALARVLPDRFSTPAPAHPSETMAAVRYDRHGDADVLQFREDYPRPQPRPGQSLIRIRAAGLNPVDAKMRIHSIPQCIFPLPKIPGCDFAGEVVSAPAESQFQEGERVFGMMPLLGTPWGASAQYLAIEERFLSATPSSMDDAAAASLPLVALTVAQGVAPFIKRWNGQTAGKRALIQGGSGGVGSFAVQYCSAVLGMEVAATCSAPNADWVRSLGAHTVIDYRAERFEDVVDGCDLILDPVGYESRTLASGSLARGGQYVRIASSHWDSQRPSWTIPEASPMNIARGVALEWGRGLLARSGLGRGYYRQVFVHPDGMLLRKIARHVPDGKIRTVVHRVFELRECAAAHRQLEAGGARGKIVLKIP